jgi:hypothetical protein
MSGPSAQQIQLQGDQLDFYQQGMQEATQTFGQFQDLLGQMEAVYSPILAKGPNTNAFAGAEQSELDAQAIQGTAANYSQAERAVGSQIAAQGGGDNPLPSGSEEQLKGEVATSAAAQESSEESQILQAGYATGEKEFENAGQELSTAAGQLNPAGYENAATTAGNAAETTANQINQEKNSWMAPVLGAVGALGSAGINKLGGKSSSNNNNNSSGSSGRSAGSGSAGGSGS